MTMILIMSTMIIFMMLKYMNKFFHIFIMMMLFIFMLKYNTKIFMQNSIYYTFSMDNFSYSLILLTLWILSFSIIANFEFLMENSMTFIFLMNFFMINMFLFFFSMNLILFFIFFEISLIPMLFLILGWGKQIDRIQASLYLLFYTLMGSMPLLLMIIYIFFKMNNCMMYMISLMKMPININLMLFLIMNIGFLVKLPLYMIHSWLPKAHVESPISGSMILASIMLKMGSYGIIRFMNMLMLNFNKYNFIMILLSLWGSIMSTMICMNMNDMKVIIAFSSIVHMNSMLSNMIMMYNWSMSSSLFMMIAHGLTSPLMFFLSYIMYKRSKSRNLYFNKGIINILPSLSLWWFLIMMCNMSCPPSLNLISEVMISISLIKYSYNFIILNMMMIFLSSLYNIFFFYSSQNKTWNLTNFNFKILNMKELLILMINLLILNLMFLDLYFML